MVVVVVVVGPKHPCVVVVVVVVRPKQPCVVVVVVVVRPKHPCVVVVVVVVTGNLVRTCVVVVVVGKNGKLTTLAGTTKQLKSRGDGRNLSISMVMTRLRNSKCFLWYRVCL